MGNAVPVRVVPRRAPGRAMQRDPELKVIRDAGCRDLDDPGSTEVEDRDPASTDLRDQLNRLAAEYDNFRKRTNRQIQEAEQRARAETLRAILPVLDNLERALRHEDSADLRPVVEGVQLVAKQLVDVLAEHGVVGFESVGQPFDAERHDALSQTTTDTFPPGTVTEELEKGYLYEGALLRPAKVIVAGGR